MARFYRDLDSFAYHRGLHHLFSRPPDCKVVVTLSEKHLSFHLDISVKATANIARDDISSRPGRTSQPQKTILDD